MLGRLLRALLAFSLVETALSANVLFFLLGTNAFDRHYFEFLAQQIALRHHNVISVKPILVPEEPRLVKPRLHLVREKIIKNLLPADLYEPISKVGSDVPWRKIYELDAWSEPYWRGHNHSCYKLLNSNLMETLKRDQVEVALVYSGNPCQLALVHSLGIPFIYVDLDGLTDETVVAAGIPWNLKAPSSRATPKLNPTSALGQMYNGLQLLKETFCQTGYPMIGNLLCPRVRLLDDPITTTFREDYDIKKRFKPFPHVNQIKSNAEFFFLNTDPFLELHALPPYVLPIGGAHIDIPKPLFYPWNVSIAAKPAGIIVIQLGANVDGSEMPEDIVKAFVKVLSNLDQYRIYWRVGPKLSLKGVDLDEVPDHINITTFVPQNDLLANKNAKLLITNGAMSTVLEALTNGVPVLGIPLYGNNYQNMLKVQSKGLGLLLNKDAITEQSLSAGIRTILRQPIYKKTAEEEYRSRPSPPFSKVLTAIEHVARHGSAKFLRPSAPRPSGFALFLQTTSLDFFTLAVIIIIVSTIVCFRVLRKFVSFFFSSKSQNVGKVKGKAKQA